MCAQPMPDTEPSEALYTPETDAETRHGRTSSIGLGKYVESGGSKASVQVPHVADNDKTETF